MLVDLGFGILLVTFLSVVYAIGATAYGEIKKSAAFVESARRAMLLTWPLITFSALILIYLLVNNHYELEYVYQVTSRSMPFYLKVTALWGGQSGSLLFWSWLMSAFASIVMVRKWDRDREFLPWVILVSAITLAFFLGMVIFFENPFNRFWQANNGEIAVKMFAPSGATAFTPDDGRGLNPFLRHPGMIIHPPLLYLGFVSFVIPFAFAIAALATGRTDDRWIRITRRWTLVAWLFLSLGLVSGGRWAYDVLGWGGYWVWDPVEIAALMPWLTGTAFLHSVMIQEKRGMLKHWNMILIILTYALVIFGTFLTRSGVLSSVHAFAQSAIGPLLFGFIGLTFITSTALLLHHWDELRSESEMMSILSREALFLLNNLLFISVLVICFWGVIFPLISELVTGQKVTVGPPFYERATSPIFGVLMLLMGIAPLSAWGHSTAKTLGRALWKPALVAMLVPLALVISGIHNIVALIGFTLVALVIFVTLYEFWRGGQARIKKSNENIFRAIGHLISRNRRRYGGYLIHISMVLMAIGILGIEVFQTETQGTVPQGDSLALANYTITYDSLAQFNTSGNRQVTRAVVSIHRDNKLLGELYPRIDYFTDSEQRMTIPGVRSTLIDDLYVLLVDWQPVSMERATFKIYHNPLVNWLWIGTIVFIFGMLTAVWPEKDPDYTPARPADSVVSMTRRRTKKDQE
jgi:cytochrome c-type biogenesis protein CcmF